MDVQFFSGLALGLVASLYVQIYRQKISDTSDRYDEICQAIMDGANLSTKYWLTDRADSENQITEAKIHGFQMKINLMFNLFEKEDWAIKKLGEQELDVFLDTLTGGEFESKSRLIDPGRAVDSQLRAAELVIFLRDQRQKKFRII